MERIANLPKPEGFFDPKAPSGNRRRRSVPSAPEGARLAQRASLRPRRYAGSTGSPHARRRPSILWCRNRPGFTNSDLAFRDHHVFVGNYHGFNTYDIERPSKPKLSASVVCPGGQGDVSVHGNLLFMSVEQTRGRLDCGTQGVQTPVSAERFRGVRIFDISDMSKPSRWRRSRRARVAHAYAGGRPQDKGNLTSTDRHELGALGEELAGCSGSIPRTTRTRRSSASTSSRCRLPPRRPRTSSTGRGSLPTTRPAPSADSGRAATTGRGRRPRG